ncbi:hypothetical protein ACFYO5_02075 [Streptomyces sp. NPDC006259]|uniref:hypothetical protein n=1 Tax=Streptomyces sp. NPDC006259 TaxID=3364740 RepID=UPI0036C7249B
MSGTTNTRCANTPDAPNAATGGRERAVSGLHRAARSPWAVLCAVAAVVLGPAAATASALEQANGAPLHHAVRAGQQAYLPADATRRRTAV